MDTRISRDSARLISSLDEDSRYIKFYHWQNGLFTAIICSSINDEELSDVFAGSDQMWSFSDRDKALRSIRRLNKTVPVYMGVISSV